MKNRVTKRMFRNMVSTTVAAAILGVSLCAEQSYKKNVP